MYLTNMYCSPWPCPCDPNYTGPDPQEYCEAIGLVYDSAGQLVRKHYENGIGREPNPGDYFPPPLFQGAYVSPEPKTYEDADGNEYSLLLYKVTLPGGLASLVGKNVDYFAFQVPTDTTAYPKVPTGPKVKNKVGKRATIRLTAPANVAGLYNIVLLQDP